MRAIELFEAKLSIRDKLLQDFKKSGGNVNDYFVRFTDIDKLGYSAKQTFGKSPDIDDPKFDIDYIGTKQGKPALWFYPLKYFLNQKELYATEKPYIYLVKLKNDAWLQPANRKTTQIEPAPNGKTRVGLLRLTDPPAAIFFQPGFDVISKHINYAGSHKKHGLVKGRQVSNPTFFQKIRDKLL